jgi:hypothetical protein
MLEYQRACRGCDLSSIKSDNLNHITTEASRHLRNEKREHLKDKINDLPTNREENNIRNLYRRIYGFKRDYTLRSTVKDENGDLLTDTNNIVNV